MDDLTKVLREFIRDNEEDINNNNFREVYNAIIYEESKYKGISGKLTDVLFKVGINPFKYMKRILYNAAMGTTQDYIKIPNGIDFIGKAAFAYSKIKEFIIPASVEKMEANVFSHCYELIKVVFEGNDIEALGTGIFDNCTALTDVKLPSKLKYIPVETFKNCISLTSIEIPGTVREIGRDAFYGCKSLKHFKFLGTKDDVGHIRIEGLYYPNGFAEWVPVIECTDGEYILYED